MAKVTLDDGTKFFEVKVAYPDTAEGSTGYYIRTVEAESPADAENIVVGDFFGFGEIEEVVSIREISVSEVEKRLNDTQDDLVLRARYDIGLHNSILMKNLNGIRKYVYDHLDDPFVKGYDCYRDILDHLDTDEMAEALKKEDEMPVGILYGD